MKIEITHVAIAGAGALLVWSMLQDGRETTGTNSDLTRLESCISSANTRITAAEIRGQQAPKDEVDRKNACTKQLHEVKAGADSDAAQQSSTSVLAKQKAQ